MASASNLGFTMNFHKRVEAGGQGIGVVALGRGWGRGNDQGEQGSNMPISPGESLFLVDGLTVPKQP